MDLSFWEGARRQVRVVQALIMRDLVTRFGRRNLGLLWFFGEPLTFAVPVLALWAAIRPSREHGLPLVAAVWLGYLPILMFRHCIGRALNAIRANVDLLYHSPVKVIDVLISRMTVEIIGNLTAFLGGYIVLSLIGQMTFPREVPLFIAGYLYMLWFSVALACIVCALSERNEIVEKIWSPIGYLSTPLSGAFFRVEWFPDNVREIALLMPTVHAFEMIRGGYWGSEIRSFYDVFYVTACCAVMTLVGLLLMKSAPRYVGQE